MTKRVSTCSVPRCSEPSFRSLRCSTHYASLRRAVEEPRRIPLPVPTGPDSPSWKGDDIGYSGMHARIAGVRGPATAHMCADCGVSAVHWSYDHRDSSERVSSQGLPYSPKIEHYEPRCSSCHSLLDKAMRREAS